MVNEQTQRETEIPGAFDYTFMKAEVSFKDRCVCLIIFYGYPAPLVVKEEEKKKINPASEANFIAQSFLFHSSWDLMELSVMFH